MKVEQKNSNYWLVRLGHGETIPEQYTGGWMENYAPGSEWPTHVNSGRADVIGRRVKGLFKYITVIAGSISEDNSNEFGPVSP